MSADAGVDLQEEVHVMLTRDAFHKHSNWRWAAFVKLTVDNDERLCPSGDSAGCSSIRREDVIEEIG